MGGKVNIKVKNNTHIKGAKIASVNQNGNGNNLTLSTKTLTYEDIRDKNRSTNISASAGSNGFEKAGIGFSDKRQINKDTLGKGTIIVNNETDPTAIMDEMLAEMRFSSVFP